MTTSPDDFEDSDWFFSLDERAQRKWLDDHYDHETQELRAKAVLDRIKQQWDAVELSWDDTDDELEARFQREALELNACIDKHLDADSIWSFVVQAHRYIEANRNRLRAGNRHFENRTMKAEVFAWLDEHMKTFRSMDAAAEAIAGKRWPIKWRTAREWVGQWKAQRSAGTP